MSLACGHRFCIECLYRHALKSVNDVGCLPSCPRAQEGCAHRISAGELRTCVGSIQKALHVKLGLPPEAAIAGSASTTCSSCIRDNLGPGCLRRPVNASYSCQEAIGSCATWLSPKEAECQDGSYQKDLGDRQVWRNDAADCPCCLHSGQVSQESSSCKQMTSSQVAHGANVPKGSGEMFHWPERSAAATSMQMPALVIRLPEHCDGCHQILSSIETPLETLAAFARKPHKLAAILNTICNR